MSICYTEYVSPNKKCVKTTIIEEVTCAYCINRLVRDNKIKIVERNEKS